MVWGSIHQLDHLTPSYTGPAAFGLLYFRRVGSFVHRKRAFDGMRSSSFLLIGGFLAGKLSDQ